MGRKTETYNVDTRSETNYRFEQQQKNLGPQLGGVIFMCNSATFRTCMDTMLFGLPAPHWCYVQYIKAGMPLFLYNFTTRELHGIFTAASDGDWEIDPYGWTDGGRRTPYPCQVSVAIYQSCPPATADQFRPMIAENMIGNSDKFLQELTKKQAAELCALFRRKLEGQRNTSTGGALPASWPGLGGASATSSQAPSPSVATPQFVPSAAPATPVWTGGGRAGSAAADSHAEPAVPADLGGKTFAQIQEEEAKRAQKAAKAAAKQLAGAAAAGGSQSGGSSGRSSANGTRPASAAGAASGFSQPTASAGGSGSSSSAVSAAAAANRAVLQQSAAAAAAARPAYQPAVSAAPVAATQQQPAAAAAAPAAAAALRSPKAGVEDIGDELTALKATLRPLIANMLAVKLDAETRVAAALQGHLSRLDDHLMKAQKERSRSVLDHQMLTAQLQQLRGQQAQAVQQQQAQAAAQQQPQAAAAQQQQQAAAAASWPGGAGPSTAVTPASLRAALAAAAPVPKGEVIYLIGGYDAAIPDESVEGWLRSVQFYSPRTNTWREGPQMEVARGYCSSGVIGSNVFVAGGGNATEWLSNCLRLDLLTNAWHTAPSMSCMRGCAGSAVLDSRMYVVGGGTSDEYVNTVEIFNPEINAWMPGAKLKAKRFSTAASVLDGCIYVTGGYDGSYLQSAERLDPREGKWQPIADMHKKRGAHASCAGPGGLLYVVGGYDVSNPENEYMADVEAFEPRTGTWVPKASMQQCRAYSAVGFTGGQLVALGGMQSKLHNEIVEKYDDRADRWVTAPVPEEVSTRRAFLTGGVAPSF